MAKGIIISDFDEKGKRRVADLSGEAFIVFADKGRQVEMTKFGMFCVRSAGFYKVCIEALIRELSEEAAKEEVKDFLARCLRR